MATKMEMAEKAFEAATLEPAARPVAPAAPAVAKAVAPALAKVEAPKTRTVKAKARPAQKKTAKPVARKAAPRTAAQKTIAPQSSKTRKAAPKPVAAATKGFRTMNDTVKKFADDRSEEHTSELQSLMRSSYAVFCLKKKTHNNKQHHNNT